MKVKEENIPEAMKAYHQWIIWKYAERNGKETKIPLSPKTGRAVDINDREHHGTIHEALEAMENYGASGIGFVFTEDDPFIGIDCDDCLENGKAIDKKAKYITKLANSYSEVSPSSTGIKIFGLTTRKSLPDGESGHKNGNHEIYKSKRFFTVTGYGTGTIRNIDDSLDKIFSLAMGDDEIVRKIKENAKGKALWKGSTEDYPSSSEADFALCCLIAKHTKDKGRINRIFVLSGLMRDKWDQQRGATTYGEMTIDAVLSRGLTVEPEAPQTVDIQPTKANESELEKRAKNYLKGHSEPIELDLTPLPSPLRKYIDLLASDTDADSSLLLSSVLGCCSAFIKGKLSIPKVGDGRYGYFQELKPNIWTLGVTDSGLFKSTAMNKGTDLAVRNDEEILNRLSNAPEDKKADLLRELVLLSSMHTMEGLLEDLANGQGGLIRCLEFGTWFDGLSRSYNAGLQDLFLELYDVPALISKKTKTGGLITIRYPFISIAGVTTPTWIRKKITTSEINSGFLARFLIFFPPNRKKIPKALPSFELTAVDWSVKEKVFKILNSIKDGDEKQLFLSKEAEQKYHTYHRQLYEDFNMTEKSNETIEPFLKRWSPYLLKLSLIMQVFFDQNSTEISIEALDAGKAVLEYAVHSTRLLLEKEIGESEHQRKQRIILEYIATQGGQVPWRKLQQSKKLDGGKKEYWYVVDSLASAGLVDIIRNGKESNWIIILGEG